jgi:hypothetical protein
MYSLRQKEREDDDPFNAGAIEAFEAVLDGGLVDVHEPYPRYGLGHLFREHVRDVLYELLVVGHRAAVTYDQQAEFLSVIHFVPPMFPLVRKPE